MQLLKFYSIFKIYFLVDKYDTFIFVVPAEEIGIFIDLLFISSTRRGTWPLWAKPAGDNLVVVELVIFLRPVTPTPLLSCRTSSENGTINTRLVSFLFTFLPLAAIVGHFIDVDRTVSGPAAILPMQAYFLSIYVI